MIDLTPLDVRGKAGDFRRVLRGYDPEEVETFLQLAAERLEELVKENLTLSERAQRLEQQVAAFEGRESAVHEALVMAQQLREDLRIQSEREADLRRQEAEAAIERATRQAEDDIERVRAEADVRIRHATETAERRLEEARQALRELEDRRGRFLRGFRSLLQREMDALEVEEGRTPLDEAPLELELGVRRRGSGAAGGDGLWLSSVLGGEGDDGEPRA